MYEVKTKALDDLYRKFELLYNRVFEILNFMEDAAKFLQEWRQYAVDLRIEFENNKTFATKSEVNKYLKRINYVCRRFQESFANMLYMDGGEEENKIETPLTAGESQELVILIYRHAVNGNSLSYSDFIILVIDRILTIEEFVIRDVENISYENGQRHEDIYLLSGLDIFKSKHQSNGSETTISLSDEQYFIMNAFREGKTRDEIANHFQIDPKTLDKRYLDDLKKHFKLTTPRIKENAGKLLKSIGGKHK